MTAPLPFRDLWSQVGGAELPLQCELTRFRYAYF